MSDPKHIEDVRALLKEGKVQEADDVLRILSAADAAALAQAAGKPAEPPPPRAPEEILFDFMSSLCDRYGNPEDLEQLVNEYQDVVRLPRAR